VARNGDEVRAEGGVKVAHLYRRLKKPNPPMGLQMTALSDKPDHLQGLKRWNETFARNLHLLFDGQKPLDGASARLLAPREAHLLLKTASRKKRRLALLERLLNRQETAFLSSLRDLRH
jgi:hypothetical protein